MSGFFSPSDFFLTVNSHLNNYPQTPPDQHRVSVSSYCLFNLCVSCPHMPSANTSVPIPFPIISGEPRDIQNKCSIYRRELACDPASSEKLPESPHNSAFSNSPPQSSFMQFEFISKLGCTAETSCTMDPGGLEGEPSPPPSNKHRPCISGKKCLYHTSARKFFTSPSNKPANGNLATQTMRSITTLSSCSPPMDFASKHPSPWPPFSL